MNITENGKKHLLETIKWCKFFYILFIIAIIFLAIVGVIAFVGGLMTSTSSALLTGVLYSVLAVVMVCPTIYLKRVIENGCTALQGDDDMAMETTLLYTKKLARFYGIYIIACLSLAVLIILIGTIATVVA